MHHARQKVSPEIWLPAAETWVSMIAAVQPTMQATKHQKLCTSSPRVQLNHLIGGPLAKEAYFPIFPPSF
jgi:hypothetical protein